jgi:hypothetical protein
MKYILNNQKKKKTMYEMIELIHAEELAEKI